MAEVARYQVTARQQEVRPGTAWSEWWQEVLGLARRWYIQTKREKLDLVFSLAQPAIWLAFFGQANGRAIDRDVIGTADYVGFMLPAIVAFTVITNSVAGAQPLLWDRETGHLDRLMSMPIARSSVIVSRFIFQSSLAAAQTVFIVVVAAILGVSFTSLLPAVVALVLATTLLALAFTSLFIALAYYSPGYGTFYAVTGFILLPLLFMSNAFLPIESMPGWMEVIARANPLTYAIESMRVPVIDGWRVSVIGSLAVLAAFAAACLTVSAYAFRRQTGERL
jgi:ABC-2 type transport system permease protein